MARACFGCAPLKRGALWWVHRMRHGSSRSSPGMDEAVFFERRRRLVLAHCENGGPLLAIWAAGLLSKAALNPWFARGRQWPVFDHIQISAAGHKIGFDANTVGILEQDGVIARRPGSLFRRMDNLCTKLLHRHVQGIDIFARAQAEAEMV